MPASYHGKTHLCVGEHGTVVVGDIAVSTSPDGRSVIRIRNDATQVERVLEFTSMAVRDCITQFFDAAWEVHHRVEVPRVIHSPVCPCCKGAQEVEDAEGNWVSCGQCCA